MCNIAWAVGHLTFVKLPEKVEIFRKFVLKKSIFCLWNCLKESKFFGNFLRKSKSFDPGPRPPDFKPYWRRCYSRISALGLEGQCTMYIITCILAVLKERCVGLFHRLGYRWHTSTKGTGQSLVDRWWCFSHLLIGDKYYITWILYNRTCTYNAFIDTIRNRRDNLFNYLHNYNYFCFCSFPVSIKTPDAFSSSYFYLCISTVHYCMSLVISIYFK